MRCEDILLSAQLTKKSAQITSAQSTIGVTKICAIEIAPGGRGIGSNNKTKLSIPTQKCG